MTESPWRIKEHGAAREEEKRGGGEGRGEMRKKRKRRQRKGKGGAKGRELPKVVVEGRRLLQT